MDKIHSNYFRFLIAVVVTFSSAMACSLPELVKSTSDQTPVPVVTDTPVGITTALPVPQETQEQAIPIVLDPCFLLTKTEAENALGEPVSESKVQGSACTYSDASTAVHVISAYALQAEQRVDLFSGRLFLLGVFGLQIDQTTMDELLSLDKAGEHRTIIDRLILLSQGNTNFHTQALDGLGEASYWAWKDFGGTRQAFLVVVKGDVTAGVDLVVGESMDEGTTIEKARVVVDQIFNRIPQRFTILMPTATVNPSEAVIPSPTIVPALPSPTPIGGGAGLVAFGSDRSSGADIYLMNSDGSGQRRLTNSQAAHTPTWSPDGSLLAFLSIDNQGVGLYTIKPDGTDLNLVTRPAYIAGAPSWSPDGTRLAYTAMENGNTDIYTINIDGSELIRLTNDPAADMEPAWSPDGSRIAFVSQRSGSLKVYLMNPDGSGQQQLSTLTEQCNEPAWSPDGSRLAMMCSGQIYLINLDGSGFVNLTNNNLDNHAPAWSPDGLKILYYAAGFQGHWQIFMMNADGSGQTNITNSSSNDSFPAWQP